MLLILAYIAGAVTGQAAYHLGKPYALKAWDALKAWHARKTASPD